jgi:hypothetical protein
MNFRSCDGRSKVLGGAQPTIPPLTVEIELLRRALMRGVDAWVGTRGDLIVPGTDIRQLTRPAIHPSKEGRTFRSAPLSCSDELRSVVHIAHPAHTTTWRHRRALLFGLLGDHRLGGHE